MTVLYQTPELQKTNSQGRLNYWEGYAAQNEKGCYIYSISWQELAGGGTSARTISDERFVKGKNIGRANMTTDEEQAILEIQVKEREKRDQGFHLEGEVADVLPAPMLADIFYDNIIEVFDKNGLIVDRIVKKKGQRAKIKFPCGLQPKYDGVRCMMDGTKAWSRNGKLWDKAMVGHLMWDTNGAILDGEIILSPDYGGFQKTTSAVKKVSELTPHLQHYVYDCLPDGVNILPTTTYKSRYEYLQYLFSSAEAEGLLPENVILVKTLTCKDEDHAIRLHDKCVAAGYEGAMVRNWDSPYTLDKRSTDLQKIKVFITEEFEIVDCIEGKGTDEGAIMYVCVTGPGGDMFRVRPQGEIKERKRLWAAYQAGDYAPIGKKYTVRFQNYTTAGKPRFPTGLAVRDYE